MGELHDTRPSELSLAPAGAGMDCTDQLVPFQASTSVKVMSEVFLYDPTAVHAVDEVHETSDSELE
jgi:hypothetical protein